jgi:hypothetical protein
MTGRRKHKINPKSLENLKRNEKKGSGAIKLSLTLHPDTVKASRFLGKGNYSAGVDQLYGFIKQCAAEGSLSAIKLLQDLQDYEYKRD